MTLRDQSVTGSQKAVGETVRDEATEEGKGDIMQASDVCIIYILSLP